VFWTPAELAAPTEADEVNSSLCHGFIFDIAGVEVDRTTAMVRIDRYVTMHDCGRILHPGMVAGQVSGGFAHALGAALLEECTYAPDGGLLSGTFADYLVPTAADVPEPLILHRETASPFTPLGAKGVGEGNCMSTPVCIANAVADALGIADVTLPLTPARLARHLHGAESAPRRRTEPKQTGGRELTGEGSAHIAAPHARVWAMLLDPEALASLIPGAHGVRKLSDTQFRAEVTLGVGPVRGRYRAEVALSDLDPPNAATLRGSVEGGLGFGRGEGRVTLGDDGSGNTLVSYRYTATIGGKVASVGGRLVDGAARFIIARFFDALAARTGGGPARLGLLTRLLRLLGLRR
jgi:2-furoyl-CoA dehydrogenase large subunit